MAHARALLSQRAVRGPASLTTFVAVGNATQPFNRLIDAALGVAEMLPQPIVIQHGNTRCEDARAVRHRFLQTGLFEQMIEQAEIIICHAGAGCVIHAIRAGKVPLVMPRRKQFMEHVDDHQVMFAELLAETRRARIIEDAHTLRLSLAEALGKPARAPSSPSEPMLVNELRALLRKLATKTERNR